MYEFGSIVDIDLSDRAIRTRDISERQVSEFLGGFGFNISFLYNHLQSGTKPLDPENILVISRGLLTGSAAPSSSRVHINALSPLSGLIGSSNVGGYFGSHLYSLGIAGLIFRGQSSTPVVLRIYENGLELVDAADLWGLDTRRTEQELKRRYRDERAEILSIGEAGEKGVRYACIMAGTDHAAGRTGLGAVMGSKKLKAIYVEGERSSGKSSPEVIRAVREYVKGVKDSVSRYRDFSQLGSSGDIEELNQFGLLGTKNYKSSRFPEASRIDGRNLKSYVTKNITCPRCIVHCKAEVELKEGKHRGFKGGRPEYETVIDLGSLCGLGDPEALIYLSNLCNILGLDTISTGSVIAFAMDLFDRGIITIEDTGGINLTWGNADAMEKTIRHIASKTGFGDVLAEGVLRASERIGKGSEKYAYHVKGVEVYGADPRGMMATALAYAVSLRGGDFTSVYPIPEFRYSAERAEKEFGTKQAIDRFATGGKGAMVRYCLIVSSIIDSLGVCKVPALTIAGNFDLENERRLIQLITGLEIDKDTLLFIGERIVNMEKLFNLRFGAAAHMDSLPDIFTREPLKEGSSKGVTVDLGPMVSDFYRSMGWDGEGVPLPETLDRLNVHELRDK